MQRKINKKGDLIFSNDEINKVNLDHCLQTFKNKDAHEEAKQAVDIKELVHNIWMEEESRDDFEVTEDTFDEAVKELAKKNKRSYDFLTKAGRGFKETIFKLIKRMIAEEVFPEKFFKATLCQLWKRKGSVANLNNHRYLHMKDWLPKLCEMLTVQEMKPAIISGGTMYQIGGMPGHCREEHLVVVKSMIQMLLSRGEGCLVQLADFEKFFDSENLKGIMGSLYDSKVNQKAYRIWFKLNKKAVICVKSASGLSEKAEAGKICPQGGFGGALVSGHDLARGCQKYFVSSQDEVNYEDEL